MADPQHASRQLGAVDTLLANALLLGALAGYGWLATSHPDVHYQAAQEDELLEWATFWAFALAGLAFGVAALRWHRGGRRWPWFLAGSALFALLVGLEEISWGQRVLGFRPPEFFLEENFQQELNLHNVLSTRLRKLGLRGVLLGWGLLLPLAGLHPGLGGWLWRRGVVPPPLAVVPAMAAALVAYVIYPWKFSGEIVELMLGGALLFAALPPLLLLGSERGAALRVGSVAAASLAVLGLGAASVALSHREAVGGSEAVAAARREVAALGRDFEYLLKSGRPPTRCGLHRRVYTYVERHRQELLRKREFAGLAGAGLPEARARYFIDPWNDPYWIRHRCKGDREVIFVYSFGPNRRRDSSRWEILGDDVGHRVRRPSSP